MRSDGSPVAAESDALVLAAARIAEDLVSRCSPSEEVVFTFAASVASVARSDRRAASLAFELATGLLDNVPAGRAWSETRGRLWATKLFAWLLVQPQTHVANAGEIDGAINAPAEPEMHVSAPVSGYIRDRLTSRKR